MPELSRVMMLPGPAGDELGRWKEQGGRMRRLSNRYSRDGERVLQVYLRAYVAQWVNRRLRETDCGALERVKLQHFAVSVGGMADYSNTFQHLVTVAEAQQTPQLTLMA